MNYKNFQNPTINPRNASEILTAAIAKVYQLSAGDLRNFAPGSPILVLLESLIFAHVEFLHWCEQLPDAILYTLFTKALGVGIAEGSPTIATITVTLTAPLSTNFFIKAGAELVSTNNDSFVTTTDLLITPGQTIGTVAAQSVELGPVAAAAGTITQFAASYSFVASVTNSAGVLGTAPEDPSSAQLKILSLLTQRNPSSEEDWQNLVTQFFGPGVEAKVVPETPNITIYIKNLSLSDPNLALFQAEALRQRTLLQDVYISPYEKISAELQIVYSSDTPVIERCLEIATGLNNFITGFKGNPQLVDVYEEFTALTQETDLVDLRLFAYDLGVLLVTEPFSPYDFLSQDILIDASGQYFRAAANGQVIGSAFDEAELGLLTYYPVIENFSSGYIDAGYIVRQGTSYYLTTVNGNFQIANATLLSAPIPWSFNQALTTASFIKISSPSNSYSHGFIPTADYTTAVSALASLVPVTPNIKSYGSAVTVGELWAINSAPNVLYTATAPSTVTQAYLEGLTPVEIKPYPVVKLVGHWLKNAGKYRIGVADAEKNFITTTTSGDLKRIPPTVDTALLQSYVPTYGTLFKDDGTVYEFTESSLEVNLQSAPVRRATTQQDEFAFITYPGSTPYFLEFSTVTFMRIESNDNQKTLTLNASGVYEAGI